MAEISLASPGGGGLLSWSRFTFWRVCVCGFFCPKNKKPTCQVCGGGCLGYRFVVRCYILSATEDTHTPLVQQVQISVCF